MRVITINVAEKHIAFFDKVMREGLFPSRSEALRHCIDVGIREILGDLELINIYLETTEFNHNNHDKVRVPNDDYSEITEHKVVRRLE
jgi:Arc/MetJ-type ribon-helix-helix transcriptional regulator